MARGRTKFWEMTNGRKGNVAERQCAGNWKRESLVFVCMTGGILSPAAPHDVMLRDHENNQPRGSYIDTCRC